MTIEGTATLAIRLLGYQAILVCWHNWHRLTPHLAVTLQYLDTGSGILRLAGAIFMAVQIG